MTAISKLTAATRSVAFLITLSLKLGNSPLPKNEESEELFEDYIKSNGGYFSKGKFYLVLQLKGSFFSQRPFIKHTYNTSKLWREPSNLTLPQFFTLIHPAFAMDVVKWGEVVYAYTDEISQKITLKKQSYILEFPMKMKNGEYYWVKQNCSPWQLDQNGRLYSHINEYIIGRKFDPNENRKVIGMAWDEDFHQDIWTEEVRRHFTLMNTKVPTFSPREGQVLKLLIRDTSITIDEIAEKLPPTKKGTPVAASTVLVYTKFIVKKARIGFPKKEFKIARDVAFFFKTYGLVEGEDDFKSFEEE